MRIAVLGAGAVGLSVAARLSTVADVIAVTRERHVRIIEQQGFHLTGRWGDNRYDLPVCTSLEKRERFDYTIVASKSIDSETVATQFAETLKGTEVVSLQNGIGNEEVLSRFTDRVIGGVIITGFEWRAENAVHVSVEGGPMRLGRFPSGMDTKVEELVDLVQSAGIPVEGTPAIRTEIWGKTMYNCALNPLSALENVPYGRLVEPHAWTIIDAIVREIFAVARAEGVPLTWSEPDEYLAFLGSTQLPSTAGHHSSMLQDLARGRRTEIDFLNGAIGRIAREHGIPAPVNSCIADLVRFRESIEGS